MKIVNIISGIYSVVEFTPNTYKLVRVIGEYSTEEEGNKEIMNILSGRKTELEVEDEYRKSQMDYDD